MVLARQTFMISSATTVPNLGFDNLSLKGAESQQRAAARALQEPRPKNTEGELTAEQSRIVAKLAATDRKVRAHEQAHVAVGGDLIRGGASFSYETGPDKKQYAVGGDGSIDVSRGRTPDETIPKAQHIREAALAPSDPSPQDRSVAAFASQMEIQARQEAARQAAEERSRADSGRSSRAVGAYQSAGGLEKSVGFTAEA